MNSLAIIRESDGKVVTFVRPDQPQGWKPPEGTRAVPDTNLPAGWEQAEEASASEPTTAEQHLDAVGLGGNRQPTLLYLRQAGAVSPKLDATEQYLNTVLAMFAADPAPRSDWPAAPFTFEETVAEAVQSLSEPSEPSAPSANFA